MSVLEKAWTIKDEEVYLRRAVTDHGKLVYNRPTDGLAILGGWLQTYSKRRWDCPSIIALRPLAVELLEQLKNECQ
jgi:hypothetical protein